jgi:hypothetical protein
MSEPKGRGAAAMNPVPSTTATYFERGSTDE